MKIISIIKLVLTVFLSVLVSLYMFETYQILFNAKNGYEKIIEKYYNETGKEYDERTKYENIYDVLLRIFCSYIIPYYTYIYTFVVRKFGDDVDFIDMIVL